MLTCLKVDWYDSIEVLIWLLIHMIRKFAGQPISTCSSKMPEYHC